MQFIFGYEMGDLIFCELDITSSLSTTKRMCVKNKSLSWFYITEKYSSVRTVERNTLNPGGRLLCCSCNRSYFRNRLKVDSRFCFICIRQVFLHLLWAVFPAALRIMLEEMTALVINLMDTGLCILERNWDWLQWYCKLR